MEPIQKAYESIEKAEEWRTNKTTLESHIQTNAQLAFAWALIDIAESLREIKRDGIRKKETL